MRCKPWTSCHFTSNDAKLHCDAKTLVPGSPWAVDVPDGSSACIGSSSSSNNSTSAIGSSNPGISSSSSTGQVPQQLPVCKAGSSGNPGRWLRTTAPDLAHRAGAACDPAEKSRVFEFKDDPPRKRINGKLAPLPPLPPSLTAEQIQASYTQYRGAPWRDASGN